MPGYAFLGEISRISTWRIYDQKKKNKQTSRKKTFKKEKKNET